MQLCVEISAVCNCMQLNCILMGSSEWEKNLDWTRICDSSDQISSSIHSSKSSTAGVSFLRWSGVIRQLRSLPSSNDLSPHSSSATITIVNEDC